MSAIIIQAHTDARGKQVIRPEDFMPLATRMKVAREINAMWEEFVADMHDGPTVGTNVAEKFWNYVTR